MDFALYLLWDYEGDVIEYWGLLGDCVKRVHL